MTYWFLPCLFETYIDLRITYIDVRVFVHHKLYQHTFQMLDVCYACKAMYENEHNVRVRHIDFGCDV